MMDVWTPGQSSIKKNWHMFHIGTPILRGAGGEGHQLSFCVTDVQGHIYMGRGKGG